MAKEFRLPDIGEGLVEVEIVKWHVAIGDRVEMDQTVVEVETDKAVTEIPSPYAGTVLYHGADEGKVLAVGEVLVVVGEPGESWSPDGVPSAPPAEEAAPIVGTISSDADVLPPRPVPAPGPREASPPPARAEVRVSLSPLVRRLAADLGVDLGSVKGSGPGGRITREDVMAAGDGERAATPIAPTPAPAPQATDERRPLSRLRRTIASNLTRAWVEIPHVTSFYEVDATRLLEARASIQDRHDVRVPIDALAVAAVIPALRSFPEFNSSLDGDDLVIHHRYDIGIAVDAPDGLIVAVVRDAAAKGLLDLAREVRRLGDAARARTLTPGEASGQTFTISNIGAVAGGGHGTPLIPWGTAGVLAVGRVTDKPVARDGQVVVAPVMPLSFSYDHRIADGALGRRFMTMVVENLSNPTLLLA